MDITNEAIKKISNLKNLVRLSLINCRKLNDGVANYLTFPALRTLDLSENKFTDKLSVSLHSNLPLLANFSLERNRDISDASIDSFLQINLLFSLNLVGTSVTLEGARRFDSHKCRPEIKIHEFLNK